jgi:hypothetical protein
LTRSSDFKRTTDNQHSTRHGFSSLHLRPGKNHPSISYRKLRRFPPQSTSEGQLRPGHRRRYVIQTIRWSHLIRIATKFSFISFLCALAGTQPAHLIKLADSRDNLKEKLFSFTNAWSEDATYSTTLRSPCLSLLEKIASKASDLEIWTAVAQLLTAFDSPKGSPGFGGNNATVEISSDVVEYLKNDWIGTFIGDSLRTLQSVIRDFESQPEKKRDEFYARALVFLQSSGMGKSRLADAFGHGCPMINYVLREKGTLGFPPADDAILSFMRKHPSNDQERVLVESPKSLPSKKKWMDIMWHHSLAVGLLQASFEILNAWVKEPSRAGMGRNDLAALRHKEMAYNSESEVSESEGSESEGSEFEGSPGRPSQQRIEFCKSVAKRAEEIANKLIQKRSWKRVFDREGDSAIRHELINKRKSHLHDLLEIAQELTNKLGGLASENINDPPLVVVFDEASSLLKEPGEPGAIRSGRYIALNRIMGCLKEYPIWFFIISTESQVGTIVPPDNVEQTGDCDEIPSLRSTSDTGTQLKRIPPFLALQLNIEDKRRMRDSTQDELGKSLSDFGKPKHMAMFGRRLWYAYIDHPEEMNRLAKVKLIGGVRKGSYLPYNQHHVFAALSFRLSLDACLHNVKAIPLLRTAINSHMRVVNSIDLGTGTIDSFAPSEPILVKAAMEHLCSETNWSISIKTLVRELLEKGLVEKGLKGELYARLVVILAHDWVQCHQEQQVSDRELHQETNLGGGIHHESDPDSYPKFMKSFTVWEFLRALYAKKGHSSIMKVDKKILEARMNFTHFIPARRNLRAENLSDLLVDMLRRGAAVQLSPVQPTYDILIPIYLGEEDEALEPSKCSCIVIQVKNRVETTTPEAILREEFTMVKNRVRRASEGSETTERMWKASESSSTKARLRKASEIASTKTKKGKASESASTKAEKEKAPIRNGDKFVFQKMKDPILFLLFDFGGARTEWSFAPSVEVSYSSNINNVPRVWAIHSRGHDEKVFGCLSLMGCMEAGRMFFTSAVPGFSVHDQVVRGNILLDEMDRSFRYPGMKGTETSETKNEDKDTGIKGEYGTMEGGRERASKRRRGVAEKNEDMGVEMESMVVEMEDMDVEMEDDGAIVPARKPRRAAARSGKRST